MSFFYGNIKSSEIGVIADISGSTVGTITMEDADSSHFITLCAPATISSSFDLILPSSDGTNGQVLKTDGNGTLSWVDNAAGGSVDASNISTGDADVFIGTTTGDIIYNSSSGKYAAIQIEGSNAVTFNEGNVVLDSATIYRPQPGSSSVEIKQGAVGRLDIISPQVVLTAPTIDFNGFTSLNWRGSRVYSNLVVSDNNRVQVDDNTYYVNSETNTSLDMVATENSVQLRGDFEIRNYVTSGQPVAFDLDDDGSAELKFIKSGGDTYINMTSTEGSSGVGLRINSGDLEIRNNSSASWSRMTGFPLSLSTVTTNTSISIPSGCGGIMIKANAPGGGGGGTGVNSGSDPQAYGGGGGGGEFTEIYINGSNLGSNSVVYVDIGVPGAGQSADSATPADGGDATDLVIKLNDTVSNSTVISLEGGFGGKYGDNSGGGTDGYSAGGLGGGMTAEASILTGIGYTVPGGVGEGGYVQGRDYDQLPYGAGGDSFLGSGGRAGNMVAAVNTITAGTNGGGGAGAGRDSSTTARTTYNGTDGGGGIALIFFY